MKFLKKIVEKLKYIGASGRGELMWSCMTCDVSRAKRILEIIDNVNFIDEADIETPLTMSIRKDSPEIVKLLIDKGADLNLKNKNDVAPLMYAIKTKNLDILKLLLENGVNTEIKDKEGRTPLIYLCGKYNNSEFSPKAIKLLVDHNANVNAKDEKGITPLMYLCISQMKKKLVFDPNNTRIETIACDKNNLIKYLIKKGANLHKKDKDGKTALMHTIERTELNNTIKILIENSGYERYKNKACIGINMNNFCIEKRDFEYIKKSEWYKWQKLRKIQLEKAIEVIKNTDDVKELNQLIKDEGKNMYEKVMLCYEVIKELTREGEMANNSYVVTNYMRMVRTFKELKKIKNIHDNIDNREYVINSLNTDLEQTNSVLDAINRFKNRVEIGINKEVLDTIDLCRASGVKIKDIRNFRENKNNDRHKETSIKKLKNRLVDLF